jgi:hypothetical protein
VDDFLSRPSKSPPSRSSTPRKRKRSSKDEEPELKKTQETGSKFRPKASVLPPSPSQEEAQAINPLDVKPGVQVIEGKVIDWRGKFGFMSSDQMEGKIFLHSKDFVEGRQLARVGATAYFQVSAIVTTSELSFDNFLLLRCCIKRAVL